MMLESKSYIATPPGYTIQEQLEDRGITQEEFAERMGLSLEEVGRLIRGEVRLSPEVADRIERVLGVPARFWNRLEAIYQEKLVKVRKENEAEKKRVVKSYPYDKGVESGYHGMTTM